MPFDGREPDRGWRAVALRVEVLMLVTISIIAIASMMTSLLDLLR